MSGPSGDWDYFNQAWLDFRRRSMPDEAGNGWVAGIHPEDHHLVHELVARACTDRMPFRVQVRLACADGGYRQVELSGVPRFNSLGAFVGYAGFASERPVRGRPAFTPEQEAARMVYALTERERQVLVLIAEGYTTRQTAEKLGISYKTADSHRTHILVKLGIHETATMVRYAIRAGLIAP
jgi:DNA-binding CsgD family transcriptional regulator